MQKAVGLGAAEKLGAGRFAVIFHRNGLRDSAQGRLAAQKMRDQGSAV